MTHQSTIIHVELKEAFQGKKNHYFGSVTAMFQTIPEQMIGVKLATVLRNLQKSDTYQAPGAIIRRSFLIRSRKAKEE